MLAVIETHPVQYHAPVYRALQQVLNIPVTAVYGSDFSVAGYKDAGFNASFAWDTDLLGGYESVFLSRVAESGAATANDVTTDGMREALAAIKPSAVLVVGYSPRFHRVAWMEGLRSGVPLLFRGEANDAAHERSWLKARAREIALRMAYGRCSRVLYIGEAARQHYRRLGVTDDRLVFSPYCVDDTTFAWGALSRSELRPPAREELQLTDDHIFLLFSGKLIEQKAPRLIIEAVRMLHPDDRKTVVVGYLGDGPLRASVDELAALSPRVAVRQIGFRNQREMSRYYHAADLFVLPSRAETWGLVVNEALLHGVPAVVSDRVGSGLDLIEPGVTGEICETGSAESLAAAIIRAVALVGSADVRDRCQARVKRYSVRAAAEGVAAAYRIATSDRERCA